MIHPVLPLRQWRPYDCGAAVLRMGVRHLTGKMLSYWRAVRETGCRPCGVYFTPLKKTFRRFGVSVGNLDLGTRAIRQALDAGKLVVIDDNHTYENSHVVLITGHTRTHFWLIDPMVGVPTMRPCRRVIRGAESAFTIFRRNAG